jgi:HD-like signal output (HDOD) protein
LRRRKTGSAFDTGIYAVEPASLAQLENAPADGDGPSSKADLIRMARHRVWKALNAGDFEPPRLPHVAEEVMRIVQNPDCTVAAISKLLHQDQFLAGAVLRVANSVHYGPRGGGRISQLQRAVARLGLNQTRSTVLSAAMRQSVYSGPHSTRMMSLWRAAIGTAVAMNLLSGVAGKSSEQAFTIGLLHDVGKPVLANVLHRVLEEFPSEIGFDDLADDVFHLMHARAGAAILNGWRLPQSFAELVDHHHDPVPPAKLQEPAGFLRLADLMYEVFLQEGAKIYGSERLVQHHLVARLGLSEREILQVLALYPGALEGMLIA